MWADTLLIVFISICTALLGEGLTWLMVYRTEKYQKLKAEVEKQSKRRKFRILQNNVLYYNYEYFQWKNVKRLMEIHSINTTKRKSKEKKKD